MEQYDTFYSPLDGMLHIILEYYLINTQLSTNLKYISQLYFNTGYTKSQDWKNSINQL